MSAVIVTVGFFGIFLPKGDANALRNKLASSSWEGDEQRGANSAGQDLLDALADLNEEYYRTNGFIFLICATGKTGEEMLQALKVRLSNSSDAEVRYRCDLFR